MLRATESTRVAALGDTVVAWSGALLFELDAEGAVVQTPRLLAGVENASEILGVSGVFPDPAWLSTRLYSRVTGQPIGERTYRYYATRWGPAAAPLHDAPPIALGEDGARSLAILRSDEGPRLTVMRAMDPGPAPPLPDPAEWDAARGEIVSGNPMLVLLPARATVTTGVFAVEGASISRVPLPPGTVLAHASHPKGGVVLAGVRGDTPYVARFVGGRWEDLHVAIGRPVAVAVSADGTVAIASGARLVVRAPPGQLVSHEAAAPITALAILPSGRVVATTDQELLEPGASSPLRVPDKATVWQVRGLYGHAPATRACKELWVPLANLGQTRGYVPEELPWLEEPALKQGDAARARFVVEDDGVKMTVGAVVPTLEAGETIIATIGKRTGAAGQPVLCHAPVVSERYVGGRRVHG